MSLADDLQKLDQLRSSGSLSDAEFEQAKKRLLSPPPDERPFVSDDREKRKFLPDILDNGDETLGRAANRYVSFQIVAGAVGLIVVLIFLFAVIIPGFNRASQFPGGQFQHLEKYMEKTEKKGR